MKTLIALALTAAAVAVTSPAFAGTPDSLQHQYWIGR